MRGRRTGKQTEGIELFPFLAVLICTMGTLIVLLVVVVQQARVQASVLSQPKDDVDEDLLVERETQQWRLEIYLESREKSTEELAEHRLRLSHLEDHIRQLKAELERLARDAAEMEQLGNSQGEGRRSLEDQLARLGRQIDLAQQKLAEARAADRQRPPTYAIVAYDGVNRTRRKPIYIECRGDRVIIQPEGVILTTDDFRPPLGPGNALASALRAAREHLIRRDPTRRGGEPYPLLIVRSDGAKSYAVARHAMKSWDAEFGYELIGADVQLQFPTADPALAELLRQTIADARRRRQVLARAAPRRFGRSQDSDFDYVTAAGSDGFTGGTGQDGSRDSGGGSGRERHATTDESTSPNGKRTSPAGEKADPNSTGQGDDRRPGEASGKKGGHPNGTASQGQAAPGGMPASLAAGRGRNWGLPGASAGATGFTRPIHVACYADRLMILPHRGDSFQAKTTPLDGPMNSVIDDFVAHVQKHIDRWGTAGPRSYWKPLLRVYVAPGGESRMAEMKSLLDGSGFEVERASP